MRVAQILCAAGPVDAVTNQALAYRALFRSWGWSGDDYAPVSAPGMPGGVIRPLHQLRPAAADLMVVHYSGHAPGLEDIVARAPRSLLVSHNITPAQYFWASDPAEAVRCQLARSQLTRLAGVTGGLAGVSEYNAAELRQISGRDAAVIPILFDRRGLPAQPSPVILFVGRLVPHKRQDLVIRAFARFRRASPGARLTLIGVPLSPEFAAGLHALADRLAPGAVVFASALTASDLWRHYRTATAFLCLSEHEGFCIPLLEAFHFRLPVVARRAGAVAEVVGDAGVLLEPDDGEEVVAELLRIVVDDGELRRELADRGEARLRAYAHERTAARLREALTGLLAR
jgi:glycosyltransferase involved in cell wall biosynthesis